MRFKQPRFAALGLLLGLLAMTAAACGGGEPKDVEISVTIAEGEMSPETIKVEQNDTITLKIDSDVPGAFHLHTYDIESNLHGDSVTDLVFLADATGRFRITFHPESEEGEHEDSEHQEDEANGEVEIDIGFLEVQPK